MSRNHIEEGFVKSNLEYRVISQTNSVCDACIIFLHGAGNTADGLIQLLKEAWGEELTFPHIKMVFPTAPVRPYTLLNGQPSTVWFDQLQMCPTSQELVSMDEGCHTLSYLIDHIVNNGIQKDRIILGGYSMGGAMAVTLAYKYHREVAGVFALSSYLHHDATVYETLKKVPETEHLPPLLQVHGKQDDICSFDWARDTYGTLTSLGVKGQFKTFDIKHELIKEEIRALKNWVMEKVSEII